MTPELKGPAIVGKFYMVPCVRIQDDYHAFFRRWPHRAADRSGWIPVIGPEHHDRETIGFQAMHLHIDVRFVSDVIVARFAHPFTKRTPLQSLMISPVCTYSDEADRPPYRVERAMRRKKCHRLMPDFPDGANWRAELDAQYSACKLKPGNICPHRGIDLTPFIKEDGTVICPGHGLRWGTKTGDLLPHQAVA